MLNRLLLTLMFVMIPAIALAHPGAHAHIEGVHHPLLTPEYIIPLLGIGLLGLLYRRSRD